MLVWLCHAPFLSMLVICVNEEHLIKILNHSLITTLDSKFHISPHICFLFTDKQDFGSIELLIELDGNFTTILNQTLLFKSSMASELAISSSQVVIHFFISFSYPICGSIAAV